MSEDLVNANSAASEQEVSEVLDSIDAMATGWREFVVDELQKNADLPCYREIVLLDRRDTLVSLRNTTQQLIAGAADDLQSAIDRSLLALDQDEASGVWLHQGFHTWLLEKNAFGVDPRDVGALFGGPIGAAIAADMTRERLPLVSEFSRGAPKNNPARGGHYVAPGVYLYAEGLPPADRIGHQTFGRLQGDRIRAEYWQWRRYIMETVSGFARPIARFELRQLALGPSVTKPPAWVWTPGDDIPADSALGVILEQEAQIERLISIADVECKVFREREKQLEDLEIKRRALEETREQERALGWQKIAGLALAAFALVGVARGKR